MGAHGKGIRSFGHDADHLAETLRHFSAGSVFQDEPVAPGITDGRWPQGISRDTAQRLGKLGDGSSRIVCIHHLDAQTSCRIQGACAGHSPRFKGHQGLDVNTGVSRQFLNGFSHRMGNSVVPIP